MQRLTESQSILMVGIAGAGMKGMAWLLLEQDISLIGTDISLSSNATEDAVLSRCTIVSEEDSVEYLSQCDAVIYSDAVLKDHAILTAASEKNIASYSYQEALGDITSEYTVVAVTGTHGKSSTTAFLAHAAIKAGLDPTVLVGAAVPTWPGKHARFGKGNLFIVEADEYREHFLHLSPTHILLTSIDFDHPDYFTSLADVERAYETFIQSLPPEGTLTTHQKLLSEYPSFRDHHQVYEVTQQDVAAAPAPLPGRHMQANTALVLRFLAEQFNISSDKGAQYLQSFPGLQRRMELIGSFQDAPVYSDYGHHPQEIAVTLQSLREQDPSKNICVILEPHTLGRLQTFLPQFVQALQIANRILIFPPYQPTGRETDELHSQELVKSLQKQLLDLTIPTDIIPSVEDLSAILLTIVSQCDVIVAFTAGKLDQYLRNITLNATKY